MYKYTLIGHKPILKDNYIIEIPVSNSLQEDNLTKMRPYLVNFLRKELKNSKVEIASHLIVEESGTKLYTMADKFEYLVKKNKNLALLKQKLNLDFD